jgi:hypothetical protein
MPRAASLPFATVDTNANLVIAAPSSTVPGQYSVVFDVSAGDEIHTGAVFVEVQPAAAVPVGSGTPVILLNGYQLPSLTQFSSCPASILSCPTV